MNKVVLLVLLLAAACTARRYQTSSINCVGEYQTCMDTEVLKNPVHASRDCKKRIKDHDTCRPHEGNPEVGKPPPGMEDCGASHGGNDC